ncbi:glycoside hydrolase 43 family protein [Maribacter sp. TH_r10]|uniref:glycoside hydrolase family 43 protein n=1 Tax=Maribacter sp. TH_r10 TaxID=3082086 RepID=UPI002952A105|nr:glycoside hydrolase 43 family protein [Maribacter sp. TH_r10]MDV7138192.1 glycoside hydrolase 43 family protein [Maribacter sp. TH_r10]
MVRRSKSALVPYGIFVTKNCFLFLMAPIWLLGQTQQSISEVWQSDQGDGTYVNPILHADYSDPDVVRVGEDYYMTASSFNCIPGLPILHSKDLVNWQLVNHALPKQVPLDVFDMPQHGNGVWAPCIRFHEGMYYIFYPDPDFGIYMIKTNDPNTNWSEPQLIKSGKGLIDPAPLWDEDGKAYLAYAFAGSRAGIKSMLMVCAMSPDATRTVENDVLVFDGHEKQPTIEGPKFYKRNGYYYLFAPAGGVSTGWQLVLRSKNVLGPYEEKIVMEQGATPINGPHQGAWVDTITGEDWFIHFQDKGAYGRVVHLQPMKWKNDWPIIGKDQGNGIGVPVLGYKKPNVGKMYPKVTPPDSDGFDTTSLELQWQWHANPKLYWGFPTSNGYFRLFCQAIPEGVTNLWDVPNLLLQKWPSETFTATTKVAFRAHEDGEKAGFLIMGRSYAYLEVKQEKDELYVSQVICDNADLKGIETVGKSYKVKSNELYLRIVVNKGGKCLFSFSEDGKTFKNVGEGFVAREGKWIGAKIGYFAQRKGITNNAGYLDIDWIRFTP